MYQVDLWSFSSHTLSREMVELLYISLENALHDAQRFSNAIDRDGAVEVIDALTGEIIATFENGNCTYKGTENNEDSILDNNFIED